MRRPSWRVALAGALLLSSALMLGLHYAVFRDAQNLAFYGFLGIATLPIEVLVVTMLLQSLLEKRAQQEKMQKLHMVIGAFFGEVGTGLLQRIADVDRDMQAREHFMVNAQWDAQRFKAAKKAATQHDYSVLANMESLRDLKGYLAEKQEFLLGMLQNANLLEHESFTDVLWAVTHLAEELSFRDLSVDLTGSDMAHINGDIARAYRELAVEWLDYVRHLQAAYPYLFSLALRRNPLDPGARVNITS